MHVTMQGTALHEHTALRALKRGPRPAKPASVSMRCRSPGDVGVRSFSAIFFGRVLKKNILRPIPIVHS